MPLLSLYIFHNTLHCIGSSMAKCDKVNEYSNKLWWFLITISIQAENGGFFLLTKVWKFLLANSPNWKLVKIESGQNWMLPKLKIAKIENCQNCHLKIAKLKIAKWKSVENYKDVKLLSCTLAIMERSPFVLALIGYGFITLNI